MARKAFTQGQAVEIVVDAAVSPIPEGRWEPAVYIEPVTKGRYRGWHFVRSDVLDQVCVPGRRIRPARTP